MRSSGQQDWYRLTVSSRGYLYALLGSLPANYDLRLYDSAGLVIATSDKSGTSAESIGRMLNQGTYYLRVASTKGFSTTKSYDLMARVVPGSATVGVLTQRMSVSSPRIAVTEVVNVSDEWYTLARMDVSLYDSSGKLLKTYRQQDVSPWSVLAPGRRVTLGVDVYDASDAILKKTASVRLVPWWGSVKARTAARLTVSSVTRKSGSRNGLTWTDYTGKVTNAGNRKVSGATVMVEARDRRGVLVGVGEGDTAALGAGATKKFNATYEQPKTGLTYSFRAYEITHEIN